MTPQIILLTGANGGLGRAIARAFLTGKDAFVWLGVHTHREAVTALVAEFPTQCECLDLDVTCSGSWQEAVQRVLTRHSRLDVLVNNAGTHADHLLATMPVAAWEQ